MGPQLTLPRPNKHKFLRRAWFALVAAARSPLPSLHSGSDLRVRKDVQVRPLARLAIEKDSGAGFLRRARLQFLEAPSFSRYAATRAKHSAASVEFHGLDRSLRMSHCGRGRAHSFGPRRAFWEVHNRQ